MSFNLSNFGKKGTGYKVHLPEASRAKFECISSFQPIPRPNKNNLPPYWNESMLYQSQNYGAESNNQMFLIHSTHGATGPEYQMNCHESSNLHRINWELEKRVPMTYAQENVQYSLQSQVDVLTQLLSEDACKTQQQAERKYMQKTYFEVPPRPNFSIATPTNNDVLLGRGGLSNNHPGNKMFRNIVHRHKSDYVIASKAVKPRIARRIVHALRNTNTLDPPCRFLKKCPTQPNMWFDVGDREFIMKTSQTLRDKGVKNEEDDVETIINVDENPENMHKANQSCSAAYETDTPYHLSWDRKNQVSPPAIAVTVMSSISEHHGPSSSTQKYHFDNVASSIKPVIDNVNDDDVSLLEESFYFEGVNLSSVDGIKRRRSLDSEEGDSFEHIHIEKKICTEQV
jgi:hypothetical protein